MLPNSNQECQICGEVGEVFKCESCGKLVCADDIIRQKIAEDDFFDVCKDCSKE